MGRKRLTILNSESRTIRVTLGSKQTDPADAGVLIVPSELSPDEIRSDMHDFITQYNKHHHQHNQQGFQIGESNSK